LKHAVADLSTMANNKLYKIKKKPKHFKFTESIHQNGKITGKNSKKGHVSFL